MASTEYIAFDLETTGLAARTDRIVEIGAVRFRADGTVIERFQQLVNPGCSVPAGARAIHGISDGELASAPTARETLPRFLEFLGDAQATSLLAHNANFDASFLGGELDWAGMTLPDHRIVDTLALARRRHPELRTYRLSALAALLGLETGRLHRALADAMLVKDLWLRLGGPSVPVDTLVSYAIHNPRNTDVVPRGWEILHQAIGAAATVQIEYDGGTRGIAPRAIMPVRFLQRGGATYLVARCLVDAREKQFRLDRIRTCVPATVSEPS